MGHVACGGDGLRERNQSVDLDDFPIGFPFFGEVCRGGRITKGKHVFTYQIS